MINIIDSCMSKKNACCSTYKLNNRGGVRRCTWKQKRSEYGKKHRYEYERLHSREFGGRQAMKEKVFVFDKCGTLTLGIGDNLIIEFVEIEDAT